jgi:hypothetical protein
MDTLSNFQNPADNMLKQSGSRSISPSNVKQAAVRFKTGSLVILHVHQANFMPALLIALGHHQTQTMLVYIIQYQPRSAAA